MTKYRPCARMFLLCAALSEGLRAQEIRPLVTVDDLMARVQIPLVCLSPDGSRVAYLTIRAMPLENEYEAKLGVLRTDQIGTALSLALYVLSPDGAFEADSGNIQKSVAQFAWSPDSQELAYTIHHSRGMELRIHSIHNAVDKILLRGFENIEISTKNGQLEISVVKASITEAEPRTEPEDLSLLVKDGYRFYAPMKNPKPKGKYQVEHWTYVWSSRAAVMTQSDAPSYVGFPEEWRPGSSTSEVSAKNARALRTVRVAEFSSPDGNVIATVENTSSDLADGPLPRRTSEILLKSTKGDTEKTLALVGRGSSVVHTVLGWSPDSRELYYVSVGTLSSSVNVVDIGGHIREIYREESGLALPNPSSEISFEGGILVVVRSTNVTPDELVKIDLKSGKSTRLFSPNESFREKSLPTVRLMQIACCDADFYGRLYLPPGYKRGLRYPLVFTNYLSSPGFYASVGDEVPILALTAHGVAVFAMNSRDSNVSSRTGNFQSEINRVERPLRAMEWVRQELANEGVIDPERCGLTGLSYGAEIAMYGYWKSKVFRAVSAASGSWEPMNYVLGGVRYAEFLASRGFRIPADGTYGTWNELSAGLNVRRDLPPLLLQSSDREEYFGSAETWFRLRRVDAPVEWYEYPDEGHVKRSPSAKWWVYQRNLEWFLFWLKDEEMSGLERSEQYTRWHEMRERTKEFSPLSEPTIPGSK